MKTNFFKTATGVRLAYFARPVKNSKIGVIIVHGLAEHKGRYEEFIDRLYAAGISVFAVDLRGHGESAGRRGDIEKFDDYLSDLDGFVRHIKNDYPKMKIALFGHSMGGLIVTVYAEKRNMVDLLILSSPSLETPRRSVKVLRFVPNWILKKIHIKKRISESRAMLDYNRNDPQACQYFTLRLIRAAFIDGTRRATAGFGDIRIPTLMMNGRDNILKSRNFGSFLEKFGTADKTHLTYENAIHRVVQNAAKDKAIPDIIHWLKGRGANPPTEI